MRYGSHMRKYIALFGLFFILPFLAVPAQAETAKTKVVATANVSPAPTTGSIVPKPNQEASTRYVWLPGCEPQRYGYRQIGPDPHRVMRFNSCLRGYQSFNYINGRWETHRLTAYGAMTCKINVPTAIGTDTNIATRFRYGDLHACSADVVGFTMANGSAAIDDEWWVTNSGNDGFWSEYVGSEPAVNSYWMICNGFGTKFNVEFHWANLGLDNHVRGGLVHISESRDYTC